MSEQKCTMQNQIRLVEYSCSEVPVPPEVPRFLGALDNIVLNCTRQR